MELENNILKARVKFENLNEFDVLIDFFNDKLLSTNNMNFTEDFIARNIYNSIIENWLTPTHIIGDVTDIKNTLTWLDLDLSKTLEIVDMNDIPHLGNIEYLLMSDIQIDLQLLSGNNVDRFGIMKKINPSDSSCNKRTIEWFSIKKYNNDKEYRIG